MNVVFVLNLDGTPLMPCKPAKASHLLRDGKATVARLTPFTVRLTKQCQNPRPVQPVQVGIDKGSHYTGYCAVANGRALITGVIHHRLSIKDKMEDRRANRRSRRAKRWYRPARFNNRASSRRIGRLAPSVKANVEEVYRVIRKLPLPISTITVEDVQVDIARINDPSLQREDYQQSKRLHPNLRLACLARDRYQCRVCKKRRVRLEAHHIVFRRNGGKDTIENLITLCETCHGKVHAGEVGLTVTGQNGFLDRIAQRTMQGKAHLYDLLGTIAPVRTVFGWQTAEYRIALGLSKSHHVDALCVATLLDGEVVSMNDENRIDVTFLAGQTRKQYHTQPQKGKGRVKYQVNDELAGFRKGDLVRVKGKWRKRISSIYSNGFLAFPRVAGEPNSSVPRNCKLVEKARTLMFSYGNYILDCSTIFE